MRDDNPSDVSGDSEDTNTLVPVLVGCIIGTTVSVMLFGFLAHYAFLFGGLLLAASMGCFFRAMKEVLTPAAPKLIFAISLVSLTVTMAVGHYGSFYYNRQGVCRVVRENRGQAFADWQKLSDDQMFIRYVKQKWHQEFDNAFRAYLEMRAGEGQAYYKQELRYLSVLNYRYHLYPCVAQEWWMWVDWAGQLLFMPLFFLLGQWVKIDWFAFFDLLSRGMARNRSR